MTSSRGQFCPKIEASVCSMNAAWFKVGMTTEMRGCMALEWEISPTGPRDVKHLLRLSMRAASRRRRFRWKWLCVLAEDLRAPRRTLLADRSIRVPHDCGDGPP